jgi:predicted MFS family arabinose efflux permease
LRRPDPLRSLLRREVVTAVALPPELLGRVLGTMTAVLMLGIALSAPVVGVVVARAGIVPTLLAMGAIYLAMGVAMSLNPALRRMDPRLQSQKELPTRPA